MTAILNASAVIQLAAMVAFVGLASAPILISRTVRSSPVRRRVVADRPRVRAEADIAAASEIDERFRRN
ncbi:MAG TPA: hypothetical protein VFW46_15960 [Stellaceae bacterium]|nr:hypothetical protein [Stellaceae bacterium]